MKNGQSQKQTSSNITIDCISFDDGVTLLNTYISKKINLSHCKIVVFSEKYAIKGISKEIEILNSDIEIRPDCNVLISKCDAKEFINNAIPTLTNLTVRYYEVFKNIKENTGFSADMPLWKFYIYSKKNTIEPIAMLCGLNSSYTNYNLKNKNLLEQSVNYKAGEPPYDGDSKIQNLGIAVFSKDKLVGELSAIESISYLILSNKLESCYLSIPNPFDINSTITVKLQLKKHTSNFTYLVNGAPFIESKIHLIGSITSINLSEEHTKEEHLKIIEDYASSYIKEHLYTFLYKTSKNLNSDIIGFGDNLINKYKTINDFSKINWSSLYKNAFFYVDVNTTIKSGSLFTKS